MTQANTQAAKTFGSIAYANGIECAPALCKSLNSMIAGRQIGDNRTQKETKAWIAGWTQANLASI